MQNIYLQFHLRTLSNSYIQGSKALPIHKMAKRLYNFSFIDLGISLSRRTITSKFVQSVRQQLLLRFPIVDSIVAMI